MPGRRSSTGRRIAGPPPGVALAAPNHAAVVAGEQVAAAGGNAVDVALAALLTATVSEPGVVSIGGGAFVTVSIPGRPPVTIDGSVAMPGRGLRMEPGSDGAPAPGWGWRHVWMDYGGGTDMEVGHASVATPGMLLAAELAQRRYGRLPWREVVEPAAALSRTGFRLGAASARYLSHARDPVFGRDATAYASLHHADGRPLQAGDTMYIPGLADFLDTVAAEGSAALHHGPVAKQLAADMADNGGLITEADLADYRPVVRRPLRVQTAGWTLDINPPPSVGGAVVAAMLALMEGRPAGPWTDDDVAALVEVQRAVLGHRVRHLEAPAAREEQVRALLDSVAESGPAWMRSPSTVHVSAVDGAGGACAITASSGYGAGVSIPGTGVWLNNCLGERELNRGGRGHLTPGERLISNMTPTIGRKEDGSVLAIGSPGADRIASAVAQVLLGALNGGASWADAVAHPRVHVTCDDNGDPALVEHEADLIPPRGAASDLRWREHPASSMFFGGVAVAARTADGHLEAAADPRRQGSVVVLSRLA